MIKNKRHEYFGLSVILMSVILSILALVIFQKNINLTGYPQYKLINKVPFNKGNSILFF